MAFYNHEFLAESITDTLCNTTLYLSVDTARVDHLARVMNGYKLFHLDLPGLAIHQNLRNLGTKLEKLTAETIGNLGGIIRVLKVISALGMQGITPHTGPLGQVLYRQIVDLTINQQPAVSQVQAILADFYFPGRQA